MHPVGCFQGSPKRHHWQIKRNVEPVGKVISPVVLASKEHSISRGNRTEKRGHGPLVGGKHSKGSVSVTIRVPKEIIRKMKKKAKRYGGRHNGFATIRKQSSAGNLSFLSIPVCRCTKVSKKEKHIRCNMLFYKKSTLKGV